MRVGAYSICYKEADWLGFNIKRMYSWIDRFSIVVGPVYSLMGSDPDRETAGALRSIPDPDEKITVKDGIWKSKNQMAQRAIERLGDCDVIIQVDSDEVWPREAFHEALELVAKGYRQIDFRMHTFWKSAEWVLTTPDVIDWGARKLNVPHYQVKDALAGKPNAQPALVRDLAAAAKIWHPGETTESRMRARLDVLGRITSGDAIEDILNATIRAREAGREGPHWTPFLLDMARVFHPGKVAPDDLKARIQHVPPALVNEQGESAPFWPQRKTASWPLWHFSYIGESRVERKFKFFNNRHGTQAMPSMEVFREWTPGNSRDIHKFTGQWRCFERYDGVIPQDVLDFVKEKVDEG